MLMLTSTSTPPFPTSSITMSAKLLFLIFAHLYSLVSSCESLPKDGQTTPTRICAVNVTVSRRASCSLLIRETVLFPFTNSSNNFFRQIPTLADQSLEDVKATAGGNDVKVTVSRRIRGFQEVQIEGKTTKKPIEYVLSYSLPDGVMRADAEGCGVIPNEDLPLKGTVWRWASGAWGYEVSSLEVTFRSANAKRKLTTIGTQFDSEQLPNGSVRVSVTQTKGLVQVYAAEKRGVTSCASPLQCLRIEDRDDTNDGFFTGTWWQWTIAGCIGAFALACCLGCLKCCWQSCRRSSRDRWGSTYSAQPIYSTQQDFGSGNESPVSEIEVPEPVQVQASPMGISMDERRARYAVQESEKKKREREAKRRQERQQQQQLQQQLRMQQQDQFRRREEQRIREQRAARQRADANRAAAQRAAQRRRY